MSSTWHETSFILAAMIRKARMMESVGMSKKLLSICIIGGILLGMPVLAPPFAMAQDAQNTQDLQRARVMSSTAEYCQQLVQRVTELRLRRITVPVDVVLLQRDGERLCEMGHVRPGITRLRMAMLRLMEQP